MSALESLRRFGSALSSITERWVPDAWVICMMLTAAALGLAIFGAGAGVEEAVLAWGDGVWNLLTLAMQFTIAMVAAHACVASRPVYALLDRLASLPDPERPLQAVLLAGMFSLVTAYLNWALCLVGCALFVPFVLRRNPSNDHMIDRDLQKTRSFSGIAGVGTQDAAVQEGMESIVDRSKEYLGTSDKAVIDMRKMMLAATFAVERGEDPPGLDPASYRNRRPYDKVIPADADWRVAMADGLQAKW